MSSEMAADLAELGAEPKSNSDQPPVHQPIPADYTPSVPKPGARSGGKNKTKKPGSKAFQKYQQPKTKPAHEVPVTAAEVERFVASVDPAPVEMPSPEDIVEADEGFEASTTVEDTYSVEPRFGDKVAWYERGDRRRPPKLAEITEVLSDGQIEAVILLPGDGRRPVTHLVKRGIRHVSDARGDGAVGTWATLDEEHDFRRAMARRARLLAEEERNRRAAIENLRKQKRDAEAGDVIAMYQKGYKTFEIVEKLGADHWSFEAVQAEIRRYQKTNHRELQTV